jgi:hypothetical protein
MSDAHQYGERKHETCRFGTLTKAWRMGMEGGSTPEVAPLCTWQVPDEAPPGLKRGWGGLVEFGRDCAVCVAHKPVEPLAEAQQGRTGVSDTGPGMT